ncbi:Vacuolar protein-sorting protein BRO1 [Neolecta irregularis DAH-3]|uniref:BRO domain-containing protein 1 n=1 Tax=Neolecta irregularis (strain DAH-3) TaxID=1198029 RepID=A0A1U7LM65_NEOID|nr:Vacuolar protein-sorting protein BRO1 [Neolecta irregularis DAH-3]|eukprot:OLL23756.1 Vacuolar protein-sorting protein BRO1 [Neolecta irregularis DAH-3]
MFRVPFINVPLKSTEEVDWATPLRNYIRSTYDDPERYVDGYVTISQLRQDTRGAGKDQTGRDMLYRYYAQLELLDLRFPIDEAHIQITFTWYDAFTQTPTSQYSLAFEKASIIFNLGAILSHIATQADTSTSEGAKTAYRTFQGSAGIFHFINDSFLHAPSTDLSKEMTSMLSLVMLAQAQEVFLEKTVADGKKSGMLAKLASQAASLYMEALSSEGIKSSMIPKHWLSLAKQKYTSSLAYYYQALSLETAESHGEAISHLLQSEAFIKEAIKHCSTGYGLLISSSSNPLLSAAKDHLTLLTEKKKTVIKDNDFIYHDAIPLSSSLPAIARLPAARALSLHEIYPKEEISKIVGRDIFEKIVPYTIHQSASLYSEEKAKLFRSETENCEVADLELKSSLEYLKLPQALKIYDKDTVDEENNDFETIRIWAGEIGSGENLQDLFDRISSLRDTVSEKLNKATEVLDQESRECEFMRTKFQHQWTQQPSSIKTQHLRNDILSYKQNLVTALQSDSKLSALYDQHKPIIQQLLSPTLDWDIRAQVSKSRSSDQSNNLLDLEPDYSSTLDKNIEILKSHLSHLQNLKSTRSKALKDLKAALHKDDITSILLMNSRSSHSESDIFKRELQKFHSWQERIKIANQHQSEIIKAVTATYKEILKDPISIRIRKTVSDDEGTWKTALEQYRDSRRVWGEVITGLKNAIKFYEEIDRACGSLLQRISHFVSERRREGGEILEKIENDLPMINQERLREHLGRMNFGS